jgi:tetratricopeptide (TPR) repeat protein
MSTIHEALKKAQREKDDLRMRERGIPAPAACGRGALYERMLNVGLFLLMMILLAFVSYSWLDSATREATKAADAPPVSSAVASPPGSPPVEADKLNEFYENAKRLQSEGDLENARIFYQKTLRIDPGHVDTLNNLGVIYLQSGEFLAARTCLEKAVHLRPGYVEPHYNLACLYARLDQKEKSLHHLRRAVSLDPSAREWALQDSDLEILRTAGEFEKIIRDLP